MRPEKMYTPFQRLDFLHVISDEKIYIRAQLLVPLYEGESIKSPEIVDSTGPFTNELTLRVSGDASGLPRLFRTEYCIRFMPYSDLYAAKKKAADVNDDDIAIMRERIITQFKDRYYLVKTFVTKNPTEEVTNTISDDGDIEIRD